ncbi:hypothetical protein [Xanthocytophaga agilis]|uniref:Uncharacterized protein n=1 Tax=Xanthocytophaga agilis TaxID=3048010 RepID=A0AAE3UGY2_9BACT|nr:hypothetical protein [Xanthocytophaga agilis]MDJ1503776.1 hypothetical protein [Xanthocytophaga agilis]
MKFLAERKLLAAKVLNQGWGFVLADTVVLIVFNYLRTGFLAQMEGASRLIIMLASFSLILLIGLYYLKKQERIALTYEVVVLFTIQLSILPLLFFQIYNLVITLDISESYILSNIIQYTIIMAVLNLTISLITCTLFFFVTKWIDQLH